VNHIGPAFIESLREIVETAYALGVKLCLEPIVNQLIDSTDERLSILDAAPGLG
jgi:hypothetical protein